jgi:hypothetical protein
MGLFGTKQKDRSIFPCSGLHPRSCIAGKNKTRTFSHVSSSISLDLYVSTHPITGPPPCPKGGSLKFEFEFYIPLESIFIWKLHLSVIG